MTGKIGSRLAYIMEKRGLIQKDIASLTGLTECTISRYINNQRIPNAETVIKLSRALRVTSDYLLGVDNTLPEDNFRVIKQIISENVGVMTKEQKLELIGMMIK